MHAVAPQSGPAAAFVAVPAPPGDVAWLRAQTDLDLASEPAARAELEETCSRVAAGATVVVEIGAGYFVDVRGLEALMDATRVARTRGGQLIVLTPSRGLSRVVQLMHLDADIELVGSADEVRQRHEAGRQ